MLAPVDMVIKHDIRFNTEWRTRGCFNSDLVIHRCYGSARAVLGQC